MRRVRPGPLPTREARSAGALNRPRNPARNPALNRPRNRARDGRRAVLLEGEIVARPAALVGAVFERLVFETELIGQLGMRIIA